MKILYISGYAPWWGEYPPDVLEREDAGSVAGGEAGMLESAFGLARRGHEVTVYACAIPGRHGGVTFRKERDFYRDLLEVDPPGAVVAWVDPHPLAAVPPPTVRVMVQQLNDLSFISGWERFADVLVSPSHNHLDFMRRIGWGGAGGVMHNGCWPDLWSTAPPPGARPPRVGYWSSPDRGLHHILRVWPRIRRAVPGATLRVNYEVKKLLGFIEEPPGACDTGLERVRAVRDAVARARGDGSVSFSGLLSRPALRREQIQTRVMAYPSDGLGYTEGFSVAVLEACAAGALPVVRPVDAMPSIYGAAVRWLPLDTGDPGFDDALEENVVKGLVEWAAAPAAPTLEALRSKAEEYSWERAVGEMERVVLETTRKESDDTYVWGGAHAG